MLLGIDIGGTRLKAGLVTEEGKLAAARSVPTPIVAADFRAAVGELTAGWESEAAAVGIGCKGVINPRTTRVETLPGTLNFLEGSRLAELAPKGMPVAADNDARAALAGEAAWGAAKGCSDVVMITLGTGVGGAVIAGGRLLRGASGVAGHLGHITVETGGELCICGNRGCLETVFSARVIEAQAASAVRRGVASALTAAFLGRAHEIACRDVFEAAAAGDRLCRDIVDRGVARLAGALAGLLLIFDPELVIVGGQIAEAGALLFDPLAEQVGQRTEGMLRRRPPIVRAQVTDGVVGAASLALARASEPAV